MSAQTGKNCREQMKIFRQKRKAACRERNDGPRRYSRGTALGERKRGRTRLSAKIMGKSRNDKGVFCLILHQILS